MRTATKPITPPTDPPQKYVFPVEEQALFGISQGNSNGQSGLRLWPKGKVQQQLLLLLSRFSRVRLCATPQTAAHQAPPSLGFSRQEHWSGLPFPSPMQESEK